MKYCMTMNHDEDDNYDGGDEMTYTVLYCTVLHTFILSLSIFLMRAVCACVCTVRVFAVSQSMRHREKVCGLCVHMHVYIICLYLCALGYTLSCLRIQYTIIGECVCLLVHG